MLVEIITKNAGESQEEHRPYYPSPSSVGRCIRALVYHAQGVPADKFPDRALLVFDDGNWHEELIKDHLRKTVFELEEWKGSRQRIKIAEVNGKPMTGEIDGLLTDPLKTTYLLEIKSINHFGFERLKDGPLDDHRRQANLYLHGIVTSGLDITKAIILYKNKNTAAMKEFFIDYDAELALADIAKFESVERMAAAGDIPARPYDFDDWHCSYCRWQKHCWSTYVDEINGMQAGFEMESDFADSARFYKELGAQESAIGTQREEVYNKLKSALIAANTKVGRAGEYVVKISAVERDKIDKDKVPAAALTKVPSERLTVSKLKKEEKAA